MSRKFFKHIIFLAYFAVKNISLFSRKKMYKKNKQVFLLLQGKDFLPINKSKFSGEANFFEEAKGINWAEITFHEQVLVL
jgi:hypothetical protein